MMDIENLIEQYRQAADKWEKRHPVTDTFDLRVQDALRDAATALSTLQAENAQLRGELEYEQEHANAYHEECGQREAENEKLLSDLRRLQTERDTLLAANQHLLAERDQLTAERDAAVEEVKHLKAVMRDEGIVVIPPKYPWEKSKWNV